MSNSVIGKALRITNNDGIHFLFSRNECCHSLPEQKVILATLEQALRSDGRALITCRWRACQWLETLYVHTGKLSVAGCDDSGTKSGIPALPHAGFIDT